MTNPNPSSDTLRTNVYTTLHQSYDKSGNMDKLVTLALCVAETENSATFEPPNISAEIVELCCRGMSSHQEGWLFFEYWKTSFYDNF